MSRRALPVTTETTPLDCVIVGAGIAGLYVAYCLRRDHPALRVAVLEQTPGPLTSALGGRIQTVRFAGMDLPGGAGIGRGPKDHTLRALLTTFGLNTTPFNFTPHYPMESSDAEAQRTLRGYLARLRAHFVPARDTRRTFKEFAQEALVAAGGTGVADYDHLIGLLGYTDYEAEDAYETMRHYGLSDNYAAYDGFSVPWRELTAAFVAAIGRERIYTGAIVRRVTPGESSKDVSSVVVANAPTVLHARTVVLALPAAALRILFPSHPVYRGIFGQPFLRVYAQFAARVRPALQRAFPTYSIITKGSAEVRSLQKIIPIAPDRGVYMIAYSDNANAERHRGHLTDSPENRKYWEALTEGALGANATGALTGTLQRFTTVYWTAGTHAYAPLPSEFATRRAFLAAAQKPHPGRSIFVASEAVSRDQGWTHGSLDAVDTILPALRAGAGLKILPDVNVS